MFILQSTLWFFVKVDAVNQKMEENKLEYEAKLDEYAQLLDIRAARIRKLESQMKDIAYGTRQYSVKPDDEPMGVSVVLELRLYFTCIIKSGQVSFQCAAGWWISQLYHSLFYQ